MTIAQLPIHIMLITPIAVALFVLGILVATGKADRWIAGYNTASEEDRAKVNINHLTRTRSIASLPCKIVLRNLIPLFYQEIILSPGVFRRETASGFYPWGNVDSPRKRVAEGLCGWRHGNSFPMTQSAQSLRQMRSIPHCSKAVFYVFVFDSIHNSATLHNLSPGIFH